MRKIPPAFFLIFDSQQYNAKKIICFYNAEKFAAAGDCDAFAGKNSLMEDCDLIRTQHSVESVIRIILECPFCWIKCLAMPTPVHPYLIRPHFITNSTELYQLTLVLILHPRHLSTKVEIIALWFCGCCNKSL
jgi:hypothetical protein